MLQAEAAMGAGGLGKAGEAVRSAGSHQRPGLGVFLPVPLDVGKFWVKGGIWEVAVTVAPRLPGQGVVGAAWGGYSEVAGRCGASLALR